MDWHREVFWYNKSLKDCWITLMIFYITQYHIKMMVKVKFTFKGNQNIYKNKKHRVNIQNKYEYCLHTFFPSPLHLFHGFMIKLLWIKKGLSTKDPSSFFCISEEFSQHIGATWGTILLINVVNMLSAVKRSRLSWFQCGKKWI